MMTRIDEKEVKRQSELLPGGDIRVLGNQWVRAAFVASGLHRVPHEAAVRKACQHVVRKLHLSAMLSFVLTYGVQLDLQRVTKLDSQYNGPPTSLIKIYF